jgi:filamentous hemagglutinin family protein
MEKVMTHAAANNILRILAAVPLAGFWSLDVSVSISWTPLPKRDSQEIRIPLAIFSFSKIAAAQPIIPEENSTGTIVTPTDQETGGNPTGFDVTGGKLSGDGGNLFHSFTQFNLEQNQRVNFVSSPTIENILARVRGGDPSFINGLIQITGGNSNLFIMNPAGIVFGANARLDVPGSFVATTSSGIGFNFGSFDAFANPDYEKLNGAPTGFSFPLGAGGAIVNGGELAVPGGENLLLIGSQVINTGKISSPGGQITIAAVPAENFVRISQEGHLLNLELEAVAVSPEAEINGESAPNQAFNPLSLPELLTVGSSSSSEVATGVTVEGDRVFLTASKQELPNEGGTAIVSGSADVSSASNSLPSGGRVNILGEQIGLFDAKIDASGTYTAGSVVIGGDYLGLGMGFAADRVYIDENTAIEANSFFGEGGRVTIWSDEITAFFGSIAANGNTALNLERESASVESPEATYTVGVGSRGNLIFDGTISLLAADGSLGNLLLNAADFTVVDTEIVPNSNLWRESTLSPSQISTGSASELTENTNLTVNATNDIEITDLAGERLVLENAAGQTVTLKADIDGDGSGSFLMNSEDTIETAGGAIALSGASITAGNINTFGGDLEISSTAGAITANNLSTANSNTGENSAGENSGNIALDAGGNLRTNQLNSSSVGGRGGDINLKADLELETGNIDARGDRNGGNIDLEARDSLSARGILTSSNSNDSGNITLTGNEINLLGEENSISSNGNLRLQPYSTDRNLNLGSGENAESLDLTATELTTFADGFNSIIIGREDGSGTITIAPSNKLSEPEIEPMPSLTFKDPVTIQAPGEGGAIAGGGNITATDDASVTLNASGDVNLGNIVSPRSVNINSDRGNIAAGNLEIETSGQRGVHLEALGDITVGEVTSPSGTSIRSMGGVITTGNIDTRVTERSGGNISISSNFGSVETGNLDSGGTAGGGNIEITASERLTTGRIDTSSRLGNGGAVSLNGGGDIEAVSINAEGGSVGRGGNLSVTAGGQFRVTGTFGSALGNRQQSNINQNGVDVSISTAGGMGSGTIAVRYGDSSTPFTVGDATANGTAGAITDGEFTVLPTQILPDNFDIREVGNGELGMGNGETEAEVETPTESSEAESGVNSENEESGQLGVVCPGHPSCGEGEAAEVESSAPASEASEAQSGREEIFEEESTATESGDRNLFQSVKPTVEPAEGNNLRAETTENQKPTSPETNEAPRETEQNPNPDAGQEELDGAMVSSVLERSGGSANVLNDIELDSTVIDNAVPQNPSVLENFQASSAAETANVLENLNSNEAIASLEANPLPEVATSESSAVNPAASLNLPKTITVEEIAPPPPPTLSTLSALPTPDTPDTPPTPPTPPTLSQKEATSQLEQLRGREFISYLGGDIPYRDATAANIRESLSSVAKLGIKPAVIYVSARENSLELQLFLPDGRPIVKSSGKKREEVLEVAKEFASKVRSPSRLDSQDYLPSAQKLYQWLIEPLSEELGANEINMVIFSMDTGLRTIPLAALHDGKEFLVEKYSIGLIPSFSLTDTRYVGLEGSHVLAMGASDFPTDAEQSPLPAVPTELSTIVGGLWQGKYFLNEGFTLDNLNEQRSKEQFKIIHLATHGEFHPGGTENSYIQFWDQKLSLDRLRQLRLHSPQVELLVLSACTTAVGDEEAELGFAGLAVQAGVKSALASLWYVSDTATLGLMTEFYRQLLAGPVKAEALREAQLAMLEGRLHLRDGYLYRRGDRPVPLPEELAGGGSRDLSHPYYWAAFTMIGSPW